MATPRPSQVPGPSGGILLVDDAPPAREHLRLLLSQAGFRAIAEAGDAHEALALCERIRPQLVLIDLALPGMDGLELMRRIRRLDRRIGLVVVSSVVTGELVSRLVWAGAAEVLAKPVTAARLIPAVERCLGGSAAPGGGPADRQPSTPAASERGASD